MRGIGERIKPGPALPSAYLVLVNPGVAVSTSAVFKAHQSSYSQTSPDLDETDDIADFVEQLARRRLVDARDGHGPDYWRRDQYAGSGRRLFAGADVGQRCNMLWPLQNTRPSRAGSMGD